MQRDLEEAGGENAQVTVVSEERDGTIYSTITVELETWNTNLDDEDFYDY